MTRFQYHEGNSIFIGLWMNADGHTLLIERNSFSDEKLFVSFAPAMEAPPANRLFCENKPAIRMPAVWREDFLSLVVNLHPNKSEPSLHLTPDNSGFYYEGWCLIPALSEYVPSGSDTKRADLSWKPSLKTYRRVHDDDWHKFRLVTEVKLSGLVFGKKPPNPALS